MRAFARAASAALLLSVAHGPNALGQDEGVSPAAIMARTISNFRIGSPQTRFGGLEFVGGLELTSTNRDFGGLSAFRFLDDGGSFLGITDTGFWYAGEMQRDGEGRPSGMTKFRLAPLQSEKGTPVEGKWNSDAEALSVSGKTVTVAFERIHQIAEYDLDRENFASKPRILPLPLPRNELRSNRGIETIAQAPGGSPLAGARVAVTENSLNEAGDIFAAVMQGPRAGVFYVKRIDNFDISDGDFLPDGDLLLLERRFSIASGVALRIRRIEADAIRPGATVSGPVLLDADMRYQIDNMEALDAWAAKDGSTRVSLVSDDNHGIMQRNLYLEFRLAE